FMFTVTVSDVPFYRRRSLPGIKAQLIGLLQQEMQPRRLALALALGVTVGLLPSIWGSSLLCILLAFVCRLNPLLVQLANYIVYPLQICLFLPYFKFGGFLFADKKLPANLDIFLENLRDSPLQTLEQYWQANLQALFAWLLTVPLLLSGSFLLALLLIARLNPADSHQ
ncbi:MAG: DUF2062 domain-containing protein, partial [Deltaproteobacteria bacterium]|nr:DUF2062 domain-containing protein [Deltaproteobacteria bacterium]